MNLLDTDWVIQALANRQPALGTLERLAGSRRDVSYITLGEVYERGERPDPMQASSEERCRRCAG
jgi:hypothetical protein